MRDLKIVIADDDRMTRSALRLLLTERMHTVVGEAMDGERAIELCASLKPDIAFIDISMPKVDGHQATLEIRRINPGTQVIMITGLPTLSNVQQAMQAGACAFVVKPFSAIKVAEAIDRCCKSND
jgi:two-component system chemotaxis response regulator CheY